MIDTTKTYTFNGRQVVFLDENDAVVCGKAIGFNWPDTFHIWNKFSHQMHVERNVCVLVEANAEPQFHPWTADDVPWPWPVIRRRGELIEMYLDEFPKQREPYRGSVTKFIGWLEQHDEIRQLHYSEVHLEGYGTFKIF